MASIERNLNFHEKKILKIILITDKSIEIYILIFIMQYFILFISYELEPYLLVIGGPI